MNIYLYAYCLPLALEPLNFGDNSLTKKSIKELIDYDSEEHYGGDIEYLYAGVEFAHYKVMTLDGKDYIYYKDLNMTEAKALLKFPYPIDTYLFLNETLDNLSEKPVCMDYSDMSYSIVYEIVNKLDKELITKICQRFKNKPSKKLIQDIMHFELNYYWVRWVHDDVSDNSYMDIIEKHLNQKKNSINSTIFAFIPRELWLDDVKFLLSIIRRLKNRGYTDDEVEKLELYDEIISQHPEYKNIISEDEIIFFMSLEDVSLSNILNENYSQEENEIVNLILDYRMNHDD